MLKRSTKKKPSSQRQDVAKHDARNTKRTEEGHIEIISRRNNTNDLTTRGNIGNSTAGDSGQTGMMT
eukprot:scaffold29820_cov95-Cyclotella_meneghiniana.AAC.1